MLPKFGFENLKKLSENEFQKKNNISKLSQAAPVFRTESERDREELSHESRTIESPLVRSVSAEARSPGELLIAGCHGHTR